MTNAPSVAGTDCMALRQIFVAPNALTELALDVSRKLQRPSDDYVDESDPVSEVVHKTLSTKV